MIVDSSRAVKCFRRRSMLVQMIPSFAEAYQIIRKTFRWLACTVP